MVAKKLIAKPFIEKEKAFLIKRIEEGKKKYGRNPRLSIVIVGENPESLIYIRHKKVMAEELGISCDIHYFSGDESPSVVKEKMNALNQDTTVDGILLQRPLPVHFDAIEPYYWVVPEKDVDGLHPVQSGKLDLGDHPLIPCTALGVLRLLDFYEISVVGVLCVVIGKSRLVGKPLANLLLARGATVIHCHSQTRDMAILTAQADIVFSATGIEGLISAHHVKLGAVVIDIGIKKKSEGKIVGDVLANEVSQKVSALSPVPGGVGPMTVMTLMSNTLQAYEYLLKYQNGI